METQVEGCLFCGKPLRGREGKKFCHTGCRNAYHNKRQSTMHSSIRTVDLILKKNRRVLHELLQQIGEEHHTFAQRRLLTKGFQFGYYTHHYTTKKGDTYCYCYDYGYLPLEGEYYLVVKAKEMDAK
jgi:hypothetical protein